MFDLESLSAEWTKDAVMDELDLVGSIRDVPKLHAKWITTTTKAKIRLLGLQRKYNNLRQLKYRYYRGECTREELEANGWAQWQGVKPMKSGMDEFLSGDKELTELKEKQQYMESIIYFCEGVVRSINSRGYDLKTMLAAKQFYNGM